MGRELDLDVFADLTPAGGVAEIGCELLQLGFGRADDVAPSRLVEPSEVLCTRHAAIGNPHAAHRAMALFHGPVGRSNSPGYGHIKLPHLMVPDRTAEKR